MKLRAHLAAASLLLSGVAVVVAGPAPFACAGEGPEATLVVDTGAADHRYCIDLDSESVSGLHVIELANQQHGLSYSLGYQGQAVCMLAGVGSNEEECFHGGEPFWGYWRQNSSGGWTWSGTGAAGTTVQDGDVEGWAWGTGNDGGSHQQPPVTSHESVCGPDDETDEGGGAEQPRDRPKDGGKPHGGGESSGGSRSSTGPGGGDPDVGDGAAGSAVDGAGGTDDGGPIEPESDPKKERNERGRGKSERKKGDSRFGVTPTISPSGTPVGSAGAASAGTSSTDGPPVAGIVGLAIAILLGLAGAWFLKRRHERPSG